MQHRRAAISLVAVALSCVALVGCARGVNVYAGRVVDDVMSVQAPALAVPAANLDASFPAAPGGAGPAVGASGAGRSATPTVSGITGIGSVSRVAKVAVRAGATVKAGQLLATFDSGALEANVTVAKTAQATARAQVPVIDAAINKTRSARAKLNTARRTVTGAIAQLIVTRAQLAAKLASLKALLALLQRAGGRTPSGVPGGGVPGAVPPGTLPPGHPPTDSAPPSGVTPPTATPRGGLPLGGPPAGVPTPAQLRAAVAQLQGALAKLDAGLAKARAGLGTIATAKGKLADARTQLRDLRVLANIAADASAIGVRVAEYQRSLAMVRSPLDGVLVSIASVGDVISPGATVAVIRRTRAERVTTWIAPAQLGDIKLGDAVSVRGDWGTGSRAGHVSIIGPRADYPPSSYPTKDVHLTRAVPIEIVMDADGRGLTLPPGAPVDVEFASGK